MARIRSVKPEFWTDPEVVACSAYARLFFIGCWNHADDYGVLKDDPAGLKLKVLPADDVDPFALVLELVQRRLLLRRVAPDGSRVLVVRSFCQHQKIDRRSPGRYGEPSEFSDAPSESPPIPTTPDPGGELVLGLEGTGGEKEHPVVDETSTGLALVPYVVPPADPVEVVFDAWRDSTGKHRAKLDPKRRRVIRAALKDYTPADLVDAVRGWRHSPHHCGENDRHTVYNGLELLLRDAAHIEQFRDLARDGPPRAVSSSMSTAMAWGART